MTISPSGLVRAGKPVTDWPSIRRFVLDRDGHRCRTCRDLAAEVDHLWPRRLGGADHIDNLAAICGPCNKAKGARVDILRATDQQLRSAHHALAARIRAMENELNEVVNEQLKRFVAADDRHGARETLEALTADGVRHEQNVGMMRGLTEQAFMASARRQADEVMAFVRRSHELLNHEDFWPSVARMTPERRKELETALRQYYEFLGRLIAARERRQLAA